MFRRGGVGVGVPAVTREEAYREMRRARRDLDREAADTALNAFVWLLLLFAWVTGLVVFFDWAAGVIL